MDNGQQTTDNGPTPRGTSFWSTVHCLLSTVPIFFLTLFLTTSAPSFAKTPTSDWASYQQHGHKSPKWDSLVEAGFDTFEGDNAETSLNFLKRAMALGCKDGLVFYKSALIIESAGNLRGALDILEKAEPLLRSRYKEHPATRELSEHLGKIYYQLNRYGEAREKLLEAIAQEGEDFLKLYLVGQIYRMDQKPNEAIGFFEKALAHPVPKESPGGMKRLAQLELMRLYFEAGLFDQSLAMAETILQEEPANPAAVSFRDKIRQKQFQQHEKERWKKMLD